MSINDPYSFEYGSWSGEPMILRDGKLVAYVESRKDWLRFSDAIRDGKSEKTALSRCRLCPEPY